jgi:cyclic-di-AMP phosphodiesterase PgpH
MRKTRKADPHPITAERVRYHLARWIWVPILAALAELVFPLGNGTTGSLAEVTGLLLEDTLILGVFWVLLYYYRRETYREPRQVAVIVGLFVLTVAGAGIVARAAPDHPELVPLPFFAMILTVLFNGRVSMIGAMIVSALIGVQPVWHSGPALFVCLAGGITAALSVRTLRRRTHLYLAVLITAVGYLAAAVTVGLAGQWSLSDVGSHTLLGAANALVSASLTILLLPVVEALTSVTTDLTLLELSDPGRPLLRRLSLEAPGTYAHSIAMANLVEAACDAIGANGLLGRVGCYYHDVGKLGNPQYFVENQMRGTNPHDRITPTQSVKIIRQHVIDGVRLGQDARLPEIVAAFIPEHHGTSEITYFLDKAKRQHEVIVNPADFRYPGPRPRSVETAVAMLADSIEAALRVLDDLTPKKIADAIHHITRGKIEAGQLDEAPITLQQLDDVKTEFVRVLSGMYHNRIDYPEDRGGISAGWQGSQPSAPAAGA